MQLSELLQEYILQPFQSVKIHLTTQTTAYIKLHPVHWAGLPLMSKPMTEKTLLLKMTRDGKLSSGLFWIETRNASTFHSSWAIKEPTIHVYIPLSPFFYNLFSLFFALLLLPSSGDSWGLCAEHGPRSWCWKDSCHKNEWTCSPTQGPDEKNRLLLHMKPTSPFGQPWMRFIGFPNIQFFTLFSIFTLWRI